MGKKISGTKKLGKGLFSEKECHDLMARLCGKSKTEKGVKTHLRYFRDVFVLTSALGVISGEEIVSLPSGEKNSIRTVNEKDIKIEHDNILKAIAYWHKGKRENQDDCHKILLDKNEIRSVGEKYCFAGKETLKEMVSTGMFNSELIMKLLKK